MKLQVNHSRNRNCYMAWETKFCQTHFLCLSFLSPLCMLCILLPKWWYHQAGILGVILGLALSLHPDSTQGLSFLPMYPSGSAPSLSTAVALVRPHHLLPESPDQLLNWVSLPPAWLLLSILLSTARPSHAAHLAYSLLSVPGSLGAAIVLFATVALLPSTVPGVSVHSVKRWLNKCIN